MGTMMAVTPAELRNARRVLRLSQNNTGIALGYVRGETVSRWERAKRRTIVTPLHAETMRQFTAIARLLVELYDSDEERVEFMETQQVELEERSPMQALIEDPPYGLRDVLRLLGRMAEGIPT